MINARLYRIMIGCPSDIKAEVQVAKDVILEWSVLNAETQGITLLPLHWKDNSYPVADNPPQKSLNKQLVDKSDLLVCIFAAKIGQPTDTAESGSIEEIEEHIKAGKPVMLYFRTQIDVASTSPENLQKLLDFKSRVQKNNLYCEYKNEKDFADVFRRQLQQFLNENWIKDAQTESVAANKGAQQPTVAFDDEELNIFSRWANNDVDSQFTAMWTRRGLKVHFGYHNNYVFPRGEAEAEYEDYMNRLQTAGYIIKSGVSNSVPSYKITKMGYDFAKTLPSD